MSTALPEAGSAEYQAILAETGRSNLDGFDYDAHLAATSGAHIGILRNVIDGTDEAVFGAWVGE